MNEPDAEAPKGPIVSPDVFTTEEAAAFLKLNPRAFEALRRRLGMKIGVSAGRLGKRYCREELEMLRKAWFGLDAPGRRRK